MRKAFTIVELLVSISIIALLASLVTVSLTGARRASRDSRRQTDVKAYSAAMEKYQLTTGSYFVRDDGCNMPSVSNSNCVGAEGLSYGRMNYKGTDREGGKAYVGGQTIAEKLLAKGLINKIAKDPNNNKDENTANQSDYILIRCNNNGSQSTAIKDDAYAVWAQLENEPSAVNVQNSAKSCGGSLSTTSPLNFGSNKMSAPTSETTQKYTSYSNGKTGTN